jgi:opacity protein-like surface antigen
MRPLSPIRGSLRLRTLGAAALLMGAVAARADDLLGLYVGGSVGVARVEASPGSLVNSNGESLNNAGDFAANHSAFKVMAGVRPISLVGGEMEYIDFGNPSGNLGSVPANVDLKGAAAFVVAYLPVPIVDVTVKVGLARLQNTLAGTGEFSTGPFNDGYLSTFPFRLDRTNNNFAIGGGVQYTIGSIGMRAEYERFEAAGGSPSLLSVGVIWTFF